MKLLLVVTELFNSDGRADMTKTIVDFRNFREVLKNKNINVMYLK